MLRLPIASPFFSKRRGLQLLRRSDVLSISAARSSLSNSSNRSRKGATWSAMGSWEPMLKKTMSFSAMDRKRALERAKLSQMTRQLMMRLQYARLKVDHGWQKQNLNEVENLYFHHYRTAKGTQPVAPTSTPVSSTHRDENTDRSPLPVTTAPIEPPALAKPSDLPQGDAHMKDVQAVSGDNPTHTEGPTIPIVRTPPPSAPLQQRIAEDGGPGVRQVGATFVQSLATGEPARTPLMSSVNILSHGKPLSPPQSPSRPQHSVLGSLPPHPRTPLRSPNGSALHLGKPFSPGSTPIVPSSTAPPGPGGTGGPSGGGSSMTYDSFWSSLSSGNQPTYKNALASAAQITGLNIGVPKGSRP